MTKIFRRGDPMLMRICMAAAAIIALLGLVVAWLYGLYVPSQILRIADRHNGLITAFATAFIGLFTLTLWLVNRRQGLDARTIQRAYVKISHPSPGIEQLDESGHIWLTITVKNHGKTPHMSQMSSLNQSLSSTEHLCRARPITKRTGRRRCRERTAA